MTLSAMWMTPMLDRSRATLCIGEERGHGDLLLRTHYGAVEFQDNPRSAADERSTAEQMMIYEEANDEDWSSASEGEKQSWIRSALHECEHKALTLDPKYEIEPKAFLQSYALLAKAPRLRLDSFVSTTDITASDRSPSRWSSAETIPTSISGSDDERYAEPAITPSPRTICQSRTSQWKKKRESIFNPLEEGDSSDFSDDQPLPALERRESDVREVSAEEQSVRLPIVISNSSSTNELRTKSQRVLNGQQCCHCCHIDNSLHKQPKSRLKSMEEKRSYKKKFQAKQQRVRINRQEKIVKPLAGQNCAIEFSLSTPTKYVPYSKRTFGRAAGFMRDTVSSKNRSCSGGVANSSSGSSGRNPNSCVYGYPHTPGAQFSNSCTSTTGSSCKTESREETPRTRRASAGLDRRRQRTAGPRLYKSVSGGEVLEKTDSSSTLVATPNLPVRHSTKRKVKAIRQAPETVASIETFKDSVSLPPNRHACQNSLSCHNSNESIRMQLHQRQQLRCQQSTASEANDNIGYTTFNARIADQTSRVVDWSSRSRCFSVGASLPHRATATRRDMGGNEAERDTTFIDVDKGSNQRDDLSANCFLNGEAEEFARRPNHQAKSEESEEAVSAAGVACACTTSERSVPHLVAEINALRLELSRLTLRCEYQLMSLHQKFDSNMKKSEKHEN